MNAYEYAVRMFATAQSYEYEVFRMGNNGIWKSEKLTYAQVRERWPDLVQNNVDALVTLSERASEIFQ